MPDKPLKIIACSVLKPELSELQARGLIPFPIRFLDSRLHMHPETLYACLLKIVQEEWKSGSRILLVYGDCSLYMSELLAGGDVTRIAGANCGEILLGKEYYKSLINEGAFLLFPEWAERWEKILSHFPDMNVETARAMVRDMHTRFVYLHTGICPVPHDALKACSEFFGLPCEIADVGLDRLQDALAVSIDRLPGSEQEKARLSHDRGAIAVMMLDIITAVLEHPDRISETTSRLLRRIRELMGVRMVILAAIDGNSGGMPGHRIIAVSPHRHAGLAETGQVGGLIEASFRMDRATVLPSRTGKGKVESLPADIDLQPCLIIPLKSGEERIGAVLSLGLPDTGFISPTPEIKDVLSDVVSVVLKNILLVEKQQLIKQELEREIEVRLEAESAAKRYSHDLNERVKEIHCLFSISEIVRRNDISQEKILQECALMISRAYQFPDITACRITWGDHAYGTENFRKTAWSQSRPIMVHGEQAGTIEVCYLEERRKEFEGPFLTEEHDLLKTIAELLGRSTERKQAEEALKESEKKYRELSTIDSLTRLYNSRHFYNQLKMEIDRVNRYEGLMVLILLDIDDFKAFNDTYGHVEGDRVLMRLGWIIKGCLRKTDSAYRYGGEEFTIILPMTKSADGIVTAERIRTEFRKESFLPIPGKNVHMTVSVGIGQYRPEEDIKTFVHRVDQLMYQAKKNGKNRICSES